MYVFPMPLTAAMACGTVQHSTKLYKVILMMALLNLNASALHSPKRGRRLALIA